MNLFTNIMPVADFPGLETVASEVVSQTARTTVAPLDALRPHDERQTAETFAILADGKADASQRLNRSLAENADLATAYRQIAQTFTGVAQTFSEEEVAEVQSISEVPIVQSAGTPEIEKPTVPPIVTSETEIAPQAVMPQSVLSEPVLPQVVTPEAVVSQTVTPQIVTPEAVVSQTAIPEAVTPEALVTEVVETVKPITSQAVASEPENVPQAVSEPVMPQIVTPEAVVSQTAIPEAVTPETLEAVAKPRGCGALAASKWKEPSFFDATRASRPRANGGFATGSLVAEVVETVKPVVSVERKTQTAAVAIPSDEDDTDTVAVPQAVPLAVDAAVAVPVAVPVEQQVPVGEVSSASVVSASGGVSRASDVILDVAHAVADTLLVSPGLLRGEGEIIVRLKPDVADGSEVKLSVSGREIAVVLTPATTEAASLFTENVGALAASLGDKVPSYTYAISVEAVAVTAGIQVAAAAGGQAAYIAPMRAQTGNVRKS